MSFLISLFDDKLADNRDPWISGVRIPNFKGAFAIFAPEPGPWVQLTALFVMQICVQCIFAAFIYLVIIQNRGKRFTYFVGYGVIIPVVCYFPFMVLEFLDLQNRCVRLCLATTPNIVVFRCIEAMHDTSPAVVETSLGHYVSYYTSVFDFFWDEKTKSREKVSAKELGDKVYRIACHFLVVSCMTSYLLHFDFKPFPSEVEVDKFHLTPALFAPGQLLNNYLYILLLYSTLALCMNMAALVLHAQGYRAVIPFHNPLFTSKSASEFWGKRWNVTIHHILKRSVFQPVQNMGYSTTVAILAAFVVSGLMHDYAWAVLFLSTSHDYDTKGACVGRCWYPLVGKQTAFFLWCGVVMLLEKFVGKLRPVQWIVRNLPTVVVSTLVVQSVLPFAHWFCGDWIVGQYFHDFSVGLFKITYTV